MTNNCVVSKRQKRKRSWDVVVPAIGTGENNSEDDDVTSVADNVTDNCENQNQVNTIDPEVLDSYVSMGDANVGDKDGMYYDAEESYIL